MHDPCKGLGLALNNTVQGVQSTDNNSLLVNDRTIVTGRKLGGMRTKKGWGWTAGVGRSHQLHHESLLFSLVNAWYYSCALFSGAEGLNAKRKRL